MNIEVETVDSLYDFICKTWDKDYADIFKNRINKLGWEPNAIVVWDDKSISDDVDTWLKNNHTSGRYNKKFSCQIEFEFVEDVVAFKLRWC